MTDNEIRTLLGLAPTADVKAALVRFKGGTVTLSEHRLTEERLAAMEARENEREADLLIDAALRQGKLRPTNKEWAKALCLSDRRSFEQYVETTPANSLVDLREIGRDGDVKRDEVAATPMLMALSREAGISLERLADTRTLQQKRDEAINVRQFAPEQRAPQIHRFLTADSK